MSAGAALSTGSGGMGKVREARVRRVLPTAAGAAVPSGKRGNAGALPAALLANDGWKTARTFAPLNRMSLRRGLMASFNDYVDELACLSQQ
ncbi:hypothetical protein Saro_1466 [Novosphingobium aromaticivorans DSM 12444]|uniref:Uncharacterized protein n=1 Tax=Novosphingobium aromaticivorans (strain ATCC 700278 / DSM 12444 / CCUG 56034 / CIP 105152 / NBRC 16084 / F199) TaxID=279238 RepID=Q2G8B4_NOVAD|nr:hypothetical protein Saro_1466 [Novosphingobium aromaticivorans DSM 12444]